MLKKTGKTINLGKILLAILVMLLFMPASGICFEVSARVDKNQITMEDSLVLNLTVKDGKAQPDLSMVKDFKVISRGQTSSMNYINGELDRKTIFQYILLPRKKGRLLIPPIKFVHDGEVKFSKQILIQVSDQPASPGETKSLFAESRVSKESVYVGEQFIYTLKFFYSKRLSGLGYETPPQFEGFSAKPFEKDKTYISNLNGVQYQVTEVNYILIPKSQGSFTIDPPVIVANVMVKSNQDPRFDSIFNNSLFSQNSYKQVRIKSTPVEMKVSQPPLYKDQKKFSGLMGEFTIEAALDTTQIKAGDSATLTLKISGTGNIMDAGLPDMELDPNVFKTYDDNPVESISITPLGYKGYKIFKKAIVPVIQGEFVIKPVELVYFDVNKKAYAKVFTDPITLKVIAPDQLHQAASPTGVSPGNIPGKKIVKKEVQYENKDIFEIKEGLEVLEDHRDIPVLFFLLCMMVPPFLFVGIKIFVSFQKKDVPVKKQMETKAKMHLSQAGKMLHKKDAKFLGHLHSALVAKVLSKGSKKGESMTMAEAREILQKAQVEENTVGSVLKLVENIESVRFGNKKIDEKSAGVLLNETKKIIKLISICIVCASLFFGASKNARAENLTATFIDGINHYRAGEFESAAHSFEAIAKDDIKNPYLFYNIGNAYLKAENIGLAILWYERAKLLNPGDPDLDFNLEHARSFVKDKNENTINVMEILFFWDHFFKIKSIQISAIVFCALFFGWASMQTIRRRRIFSGVGITVAAVVVFISLVLAEHYYSLKIHPCAVIVVSEAAVRSGVNDSATKLFSLHEGTKVVVKDRKNGYLKILFSKGKAGWIKIDQAVII